MVKFKLERDSKVWYKDYAKSLSFGFFSRVVRVNSSIDKGSTIAPYGAVKGKRYVRLDNPHVGDVYIPRGKILHVGEYDRKVLGRFVR